MHIREGSVYCERCSRNLDGTAHLIPNSANEDLTKQRSRTPTADATQRRGRNATLIHGITTYLAIYILFIIVKHTQVCRWHNYNYMQALSLIHI